MIIRDDDCRGVKIFNVHYFCRKISPEHWHRTSRSRQTPHRRKDSRQLSFVDWDRMLDHFWTNSGAILSG